MRIVLALAVLGLAAAGCGGDETPVAPGEPPTAPAEPPAEPETMLELTVWPEGEAAGRAQSYTLSCDPPAGDHPDPEAACAALDRLGAGAFDPVPAEAMCTQQYGGPMEARVVGRVGGVPVDAMFRYTDGCEIARWDAVVEVVPRPDWQSS